MILIAISIYMTSAILTYGFEFASWQSRFGILAEDDKINDMLESLKFAILGPVGLIIALSRRDYRYGLKFW